MKMSFNLIYRQLHNNVVKYVQLQNSPLGLLHIRKHNGFVTKLLHYTIAFTFNRCASQGLSLLNIFIFIPQIEPMCIILLPMRHDRSHGS